MDQLVDINKEKYIQQHRRIARRIGRSILQMDMPRGEISTVQSDE